MSEVKRWSCQVYSGVPEAHSCGEIINLDEIDVEFVKAEDYDALREDLRCARHGQNMILSANGMLSERLADAERRNVDQLTLLHMAKELLSTISLHRTMAPVDWCDSFKNEVADRLEKLRSALNPNPEAASHE